jgi:hypothetical protein
MRKPLPEDEWKLEVNTQYQEAMKVAINLATASLVLPIVFLKVFVGAEQFTAAGRPASAYCAWILLLGSVLCGMGFYYTTAKFVKAVCGGFKEKFKDQGKDPRDLEAFERMWEKRWENRRDFLAVVVAVCFFGGIVSLLVFFLTLAPARSCL